MLELEELLKLAYEIRNDIFDSSSSVSSIVKKYYTFLQYMNEKDDIINGELYGYKNDKVPRYRQKLFRGSPITGSNDYLYKVKESIALIEKSKDTGRKTTYMNELTYLPRTFDITSSDMYHIMESVKNFILVSINKKIIEMEYSDINYKIFEETKKYVDNKLSEIDSNIIKNLIDSYNKLKLVKDTNSASQIAFSCRQILQDFTDKIFEQNEKLTNKPNKNLTKNKLSQILSVCESKRNKKLIESQYEYFSKFSDYIEKNVHPDKYELFKEDANRCIIYTYLIIGDILKILE